MIKNLLITLHFLALLVGSGSCIAAAEVMVSNQERVSLLPHISWYYDATARATINQLSPRPTLFQHTLDNASLARAKGACWLHFRVTPTDTATTKQWLIELAYTQLDLVDLYLRSDPSAPWQRQQAGDLRPASSQALVYPQPVFQLPLNKGEVTEVFLRIESSTSISLPLVLWQQRAFEAHHLQTLLIDGIVYGVLIGLLLYNLFLYPTVRDNAYLWFSLYLASFLFFQLSMAGLTRLYLFSNWPAMADRSATLAMWLCIAAGIRFTQYIALSKQYTPRLNRLFNAIFIFSLLMFVAVASLGPGPLFFMLPLAGVVVALLIPLPLFAAWQAHYPPAKFTLLAFLPIFPGVIFLVARSYGLVESSFWSEHLLPVGTAGGAVLLSFALADRISFLRNEKIAAQTKLIETIQAAEAAKKSFSAQLINAQDSERKRIAAELHDGVGQNLSFLASSITRLTNSSDNMTLQQIKQVSRDTVNEVRNLSHTLHPHILDQLGLASAIESIAEQINDQHPIKCKVLLSGALTTLDEKVELHLYRIVQEAARNAIKHSRATEIIISLQRERELVTLSITDNGTGLTNASLGRGLGLESMRHRATLLSGHLMLKSVESGGLNIVITLTIEESR